MYYVPKKPSAEKIDHEEQLRKTLDRRHAKLPCAGVRKLRRLLRDEGFTAGCRLIRRLMDGMELHAAYPTKASKDLKMLYLLKNMNIFLPNQAWAADITYIPVNQGHMQLTAVEKHGV